MAGQIATPQNRKILLTLMVFSVYKHVTVTFLEVSLSKSPQGK